MSVGILAAKLALGPVLVPQAHWLAQQREALALPLAQRLNCWKPRP